MKRIKIKFTGLTKLEQELIIANAGFTDRQLNIFTLKCKGKSIIEISSKVAMSEAVVCKDISDIKNKISRCFNDENKAIQHLKLVVNK